MTQKHDFPGDAEELFEYFSGFNTEKTTTMLSAEDIVFCGKLLPYKNMNTPPPRPTPFVSHSTKTTLESSASPRSQSTAKARTRKPSLTPSTERTSSGKHDRRASVLATAKPKRPPLMFGIVKTPGEMELKDIRSRQNRLITSGSFRTYEAASVRRRDEEKSSWSLLRALSCKGGDDGVIAASLSRIR